MKATFLTLSVLDRETVHVSGSDVLTIAVTRCLRPFQERVWGRNSSLEVFIFEKTRSGLRDVTLRDKDLPQYVGFVPMVKMMEII